MNEQSLGSMAEDNNNQDNKKPHMKDNVVFFPFHRIKDLNKARSKIDPKTEKQIKQIHNQIYVQQCVDDICTVIMRYLHEEKVQLQNPILMKDFKLVNESIKSMLARYVGNKHNLQKIVDKCVVSHKKGKALFNFVIDYENLPLK
tara:strand:+ start:3479 stop:3913 length:435 start_codon:yes stop_codon:yes gene_type:complete